MTAGYLLAFNASISALLLLFVWPAIRLDLAEGEAPISFRGFLQARSWAGPSALTPLLVAAVLAPYAATYTPETVAVCLFAAVASTARVGLAT